MPVLGGARAAAPCPSARARRRGPRQPVPERRLSAQTSGWPPRRCRRMPRSHAASWKPASTASSRSHRRDRRRNRGRWGGGPHAAERLPDRRALLGYQPGMVGLAAADRRRRARPLFFVYRNRLDLGRLHATRTRCGRSARTTCRSFYARGRGPFQGAWRAVRATSRGRRGASSSASSASLQPRRPPAPVLASTRTRSSTSLRRRGVRGSARRSTT